MGPDVTVKTGVEVSVCETGRLSIGAHSYLHAYSWFLLTMPHPTVVLGKWVDVDATKQLIMESIDRANASQYAGKRPGAG